jgi:hypothetical protein
MKNTNKFMLAIIFLSVFLTGCQEDKKAQAAADAAYEAKFALEREANTSGGAWYEVRLEKFGGQCLALERTARVDVDSYHDMHTTLVSAEKDGGHYWLSYRLSSPFNQRIYTTSVEWCDRTIAANTGR